MISISSRCLAATRTLGTLALLTLSAMPARAEGSDPAAAEALFRAGIELKKAGKLDEACPKLEESHRLDPAGGTLYWLADCLELSGKTASAWARFQEARELARRKGNAEKEAESARRAAALEAKVPRLSVVVPASLASVDGLAVRRDGLPLGKAAWGTPLPIDPGSHVVEASAPGKKSWSGRIDVPAGPGTLSIAVPELEGAAAAPAVPAPSTTPAEPAPSPRGATQRYVGYGLAGAGVLGGVLGAVFWSKRNASESDAAPHCPPARPEGCDADGHALYEDAKRAHTEALVSWVAGGVLLAGGVALILTAPSGDPRRATLWVAPRAGGLTVGGALLSEKRVARKRSASGATHERQRSSPIPCRSIHR